MSHDSAPEMEELVALLHAISGDERLCKWLLALQELPLPARAATLRQMAADMRAAGEDANLADAIAALIDPRICDAACKTLRELYFPDC